MLSGLFKWISGFQVKTQYEASLLKASYPDEYAPDEVSMQTILQTFSGKNQEIRAQVAVIEFFKLLDKGDYKNYWTFNLKMIVIMDRCLEQRLIIEDIIAYQNRQLAQYHSVGHSLNSTLTNNLISRYYAYIKKKALAYNQPRTIFSVKPRDRLGYISKMSMENICQVIKTSHQLHSEILKISNNYKNGDRKNYLIQYVFCNLLNTSLSCYTIQSICTSVLITKIPSLDFQQLMLVKQSIQQMNRTTKQTVRFIEANKELEGFKDLKYGQFFSFDQKIISILDDALKNFDEGRKSTVRDIDIEQWQANQYQLEVSRATLEKKQYQSNTHFLPGQPRRVISENKQNTAYQIFRNFKNQYNDTHYQNATSESQKGKRSGSASSRTFSYTKPSKFNQTIWQNFKNVFS